MKPVSGRVREQEQSTASMPNIAAEVGMTSALYNPVETCLVIVQMELVNWLRSQTTITHPVPYTHKHVHSYTQKENCVWKKIILQPTTSETLGRTEEW